MRVSSVSARYVEALFQLARERARLAEVERDVEHLAGRLGEPELSGVLFDARVEWAVKHQRLLALEGQLGRLTFDFVRLLADKRRLEVLRELRPAFRRRLLQERNAAEGVVESARPLAAAEIDALRAVLSAKLGKEVLLQSRLVPELVGGVRVLVENRMIDQSVQGRLSDLRQKLRKAPLPSV